MMLAVVAVILPTNGWAQGTTAGDGSAEAYVVTTDTTITFYYDSQRSSRGGLEILPDDILWYQFGNYIWKATFDPSFAGCTNLTSTANWFSGFTRLTTIVGLENLNTSTVTNMSGMFTNCSSLTSLDLTGLNTGNVTNMSHMFEGCEKLENLNVSSFNTSRVTTMKSMFAGCHALLSLDLTNFDTGNVIDMADMFFSMFEIKILDLSSFNTSRVVCMSGMFDSMLKLQTIYVSSGWTTASIDLSYTAEGHDGSANGRVFNSNEQLVGGAGTVFNSNYADYTYAHIDGGENNPGYFTDKNAAPSSTVAAPVFTFEGDNLVMSTETPNASIFYKMEDVPDMSDTEVVESLMNHLAVTAGGQQSTYYQQPIELTRNVIVKAIAVIDNETGTIASDTTSLAYNYEAWVNLMVAVERGNELYERAKNNSNVQQESLENLQWALEEGNMIYAQRAEMPYFEAQHFAERINEICAEIEAQMNASSTPEPYAVLSDNNTVLTFYYDDQKTARGGMDINNSYIDDEGSSAYGTATMAVFDASFANYLPTSTAYWFQRCTLLTEIRDLSNLNTAKVIDMGYMFHGCSALTALDLGSFNTENVTNMRNMFSYCSSLTSLDLSHFNTANVKLMYNMFFYCSGLTSLDVSGFNTANVTGMIGMFDGCSSLTSLDVSGFNTANVESMNAMFEGCSGLTTLNVTNFNTAKVTEMDSMFGGCSSLTSLDVSGFNTANVERMNGMFFGCSSLQTVYVGDGWSTTNVTESTNVFTSCTSLIGGAGTKYDENHTDYTYAHIDGGTENPGYFTRSGEAPWVEPTEKVATPTFSWSDDNLTITTETEGAEIYYSLGGHKVAMLVPSDYASNADEKAAVDWFTKNYVEKGQGDVITHGSGIEKLKDGGYSVCWVMCDRTAMERGATNLPDYMGRSYVTDILKSFAEKGGNLLLTNHATQLVSSVGRIEAVYDPGIFGSGEGAQINDVWGIQPVIGNQDGQIYDHHDHPIYAGMTFADPGNTYGHPIYSLEGAGFKGDHNCMWDLNSHNLTANPNIVKAWEELTNSTVLGTWQHVTDYCCAGIVDFEPTSTFPGRVLAVGLASYEWDMNGGTNPYQSELELFTTNCLAYLGGSSTLSEEDYQLYSAPVEVKRNATIHAFARKQGMADSEVATLVYPYESWMRLIETCEMGRYIAQQAYGNSNVPQDMLQNLEMRIQVGGEMYSERTAEQQEIEEYVDYLRYLIAEIEQKMNEPTSTFDGRVLTVRGSGSIDHAVAQVGGYDYVNSTITAIVWEADVPYYGETAFTNPNLLFYANEATKDQPIRNLIYNGVAESITLTSQGEGNIDFYCPQPFTARYITYQRNFSQQTEIGVSRGWETIALPFTVQRIAHERYMEDGKTNNLTPFGTNDDNKHFWLRRMTGNGFQSVQTMEANVPYIISMPNSDAYPAEYNLAGNIYFTAENVEVPATTLVTDEWGEYTMTSTFQRLGAQESIYVLNVGEVRNGYPEGSIFERNYRATRPFEAYTTHRGSSPAPKFFMIGMPGDDGTTGIATVGMGSPNADNWYDLQGRKLQGKPTRKGVYIQNGKKITIK